MNSLEYQLTIKSANQKVDDYSLICKSNWTVARLKQHISETHVNKPNVGDQRLIYAGNLLKDSLTLKQVFFRDSLCTELTNSSKTDFTIHLVCSTSAQRSQTTTSTSPRAPISNTAGSNQAGQTRTQQQNPPPPRPAVTSNQAIPTAATTNGGGSATMNQSTSSSSNSNASGAAPSSQTNNGAQAIPLFTNPSISSTHASEIAQRLLQTDQVRQQLAIFQQLANLVAAELAQNLVLNSSLAAASPPSTTSVADSTTEQQPALNVPNAISSVLSSQVLNLPTSTTADATPTAAGAAAGATQINNGNNLAAESIASQILYANQLNQPGGLHQNRHHNLNGDNNVNGPGVGHQAQTAAAAAVAGPQQQAPVPQAPIIDQPVPPQAVDPEPAMQHDVIDWVYYSIRALILMVALYIHASLFRLLFIVGLLAVAYFFNRRSARRQNQAQAQAAAAAAAHPPRPAAPAENHRDAAAVPPPPDRVDQGDDVQNQNGELRQRRVVGAEGQVEANNERNDNQINDNQQDRAHRQDNVGAEQIAQRRVSFLKLCYLVVTDFLASLVPE